MAYEFNDIVVNGTISGAGVSARAPVLVATTVAGTLTTSFQAGNTIDGVVLVANDRILIKNQALATENGIYIIQAGTPLRSSDCYTGASFSGIDVHVKSGTLNATTSWICNSAVGSDIVGTNNITFIQQGQVTFTGSEALANKTITGSSIDSTNVGASSAGTGRFTTLEATTSTQSPFITLTNTTNQLFVGTTNVLTINSPQSGSAVLTLPDLVNTPDTAITANLTQSLTNKSLTSNTNNVIARSLWTGSGAGSVSVYAATAPTTGQVLTATSGTVATWQDPTGGSGITTLNTLTATTQTFAVGTTGSDFNISSATSTHTFNIPDAGAAARGLVTTGVQTFAGVKTFSSAPVISSITNTGTLTLPTTTDTLVGQATSDTLTNKSLVDNSTFIIDNTDATKRMQLEVSNIPTATTRIFTSPNAAADCQLVCLTSTDTLTNKTITGTTNTVAAKSLLSATTNVDVFAAAAPTIGQVLTATSGTAATWQTPAATGISTLNTLTAATQTFAVGTTGSDFNISSATSTHTFNIPDAGATARGLVTTGAQTFAGVKTFSSAPVISSITNTGTLTLPTTTDTLVGRDTTDTLTNKTITGTTNTVAAKSLLSATTNVDVFASTAPVAGQVLTATSGTAATWQNPTNAPGSGITTLNGLTITTQTMVVGTTGTDFNISSNTSTHTFNIPDASETNRGLMTTGAQTFAGVKTFTDLIIGPDMPEPSAPAAGAKLFSRFLTGRNMASQIGPSGMFYTFQPGIYGQKIATLIPNANATTVTTLGAVWTAAGTATARPQSNASFVSSVARIGYVTANPSGSSAGVRSAVAQFWRGDAANRGGFFFSCRFFIASTQASQRSFVGLYGTTAAIANVEPSTLLNVLGFANDTTQSTLQFIYNDGAGAVSTIALTGFAAQTTASTNFYEARMYCKPNDTAVYYSIQLIPTGTYLEGSVSTNIPLNTQFLAPHVWTNNGGSNGTLGIDVINLYVETDN